MENMEKMEIYSLVEKKRYQLSELSNIDTQKYIPVSQLTPADVKKYTAANKGKPLKGAFVSVKDPKYVKIPSKRFRVIGITPGKKTVSKFISKETAGSGLIGSLIGMPDGIPGLSSLPIIGALF